MWSRSARPRTGRTLVARTSRTSGWWEPELRQVRHLHAGRQLAGQTQATVATRQRAGEPGRQSRRLCASRTAARSATLTSLALLSSLGRAPRAHPRHLLHHLASFEEAVDQAVHFGDSDT